MFDWVPIQQYAYYYFQIVLFLTVLIFIHNIVVQNYPSRSILFNKFFGLFFVFFIILYIGLRPLNGVFIDMTSYAQTFEQYQDGADIKGSGDRGFELLIQFCAKTVPVEFFFFICALIYIVPIWLLSKKFFGPNWFYAFFILAGSFSFWSYGTNGIRNGMASTLFLFAFYFYEKKIIMALFLALSISFHQSMTLPALALGLTMIKNIPKQYLIAWFTAIPLSLALGGFWEVFFAGLGFGDDRTSYLVDDTYESAFSSSGFRWDFLLYSATGVFAGFYYIIKNKYEDKLYIQLFNTYLLTNAFWVLVIRASFSNRFAYLSWFMLGLVVIYPLLKPKNTVVNHVTVGKIILLYYSFTYIMNVILVKS